MTPAENIHILYNFTLGSSRCVGTVLVKNHLYKIIENEKNICRQKCERNTHKIVRVKCLEQKVLVLITHSK